MCSCLFNPAALGLRQIPVLIFSLTWRHTPVCGDLQARSGIYSRGNNLKHPVLKWMQQGPRRMESTLLPQLRNRWLKICCKDILTGLVRVEVYEWALSYYCICWILSWEAWKVYTIIYKIALIQPFAMEITNGCNSEVCVVQLEEMHWFKEKIKILIRRLLNLFL